jgi:hypothetical protein
MFIIIVMIVIIILIIYLLLLLLILFIWAPHCRGHEIPVGLLCKTIHLTGIRTYAY